MKINQALALTVYLLFIVAAASAQTDKDYQDLRTLYIDEKYEKLIAKGERYLGKSDSRKDPAPYLYLSKAYYEISRMEEMHDEYPPEKSFANAMKWATKYRKKDPDGVLFRENEMYFEELKKSALEEAAGYMADQKYSRAKRLYDGITKFDPDDAGAWLLLGLCQMEMRSMTEANMTLKKAGEVLHDADVSSYKAQDKATLRNGGLGYVNYLIEEGRRDSARSTLDLLRPALSGDQEFDLIDRRAK